LKGKTEGLLWQLSESLLPKGRAALFNQALMDLGAMICTPKNSLCLQCPLADICKACGSGRPERFPLKTTKKKVPHIKAVSAIIRRNGKILLRQRPPKGLLGGLWEFPNWRFDGKKDLMEFLTQKVKGEIGLTVKCKALLGTFQQTYSHFKLTLFVFYCDGVQTNKKVRWISISQLRLLPMSRIDRKIADTVQRSHYKTNPKPQ
jgi:A/G-specific adenine glycosylase